MCGLIAILNRKAGGWDHNSAHKAVQRGLDAMSPRGVPGRSAISERNLCVLGHTRLPIINLSTKADQPMEAGGTLVGFVGELFNYQKFSSDAVCDTQVFGEQFSLFGPGVLHEFDGFWSAVVVDFADTFVLTDYLSQKPLYFHRDSLLVASEPEAIAAALPFVLTPDPIYFSNVLKWGYDPTGRTPYEGVSQLPPGHMLICNARGELKEETYWNWGRIPYESDLLGLIVEAVNNRLVGDREIALLLSGGLDSTLIFRILVDLLDCREVSVFHAENDEEEFVKAALEGYPSKPLKVQPVELEDALKAHQVPVDLGSMLPQLGLARALRERKFHVALSGDGADELFGGYRRAKEYDSQGSDVFCELPYYHLPRLDRIMMSQTIELRSPYLAPKVIKHALALPWEARQEKQALKLAAHNLVPNRILQRAKHPLKSTAVLEGGLEYRKCLINLWQRTH